MNAFSTWGKRHADELGIFLLALIVRLATSLWAWDRVPPTADGSFYHVVAQRIASGDGYTWLWPDGAITYAAHYPVGYPALMGPLYALFGPIPGVVMLMNALLGSWAVALLTVLSRDAVQAAGYAPLAKRASFVVGVALAVSPTLVGYTPALMTEGAVAACVTFASWFCLRHQNASRPRAWLFVLIVGFVMAAATYLRPQSVLLAPVVGLLGARGAIGRRIVQALLVSAVTVSLVLPWTLRNCDKMESCVFVSANGGWNLLIGTFPEGEGAWVALEGERVPEECREVFQEAEKDACFGAAARRRIAAEPHAWLNLVPDKMRATFDHTAAAKDHLSAAGALDEEGKETLAYAEFIWQRLLFIVALVGAFVAAGRGTLGVAAEGMAGTRLNGARVVALGLGVVGFLGFGAVWGWAAMVLLCLMNPAFLQRIGPGVATASFLLTALVHASFFGAGRYSLPLLLAVAPLGAVGAAAFMQVLGRKSPSERSSDRLAC